MIRGRMRIFSRSGVALSPHKLYEVATTLRRIIAQKLPNAAAAIAQPSVVDLHVAPNCLGQHHTL
jgi:hypothetical protein